MSVFCLQLTCILTLTLEIFEVSHVRFPFKSSELIVVTCLSSSCTERFVIEDAFSASSPVNLATPYLSVPHSLLIILTT